MNGKNKKRILFNVESPNFTGTSTPTKPSEKSDMTSPATPGQHLSKFEKPAENAASEGFRSNFSGTAFCLPHQVVGFLF